MASVTARNPNKPLALGRDMGPSMNRDPLLSFMCTGVKQAEPGTPSKARGPSTKVPPHSQEQEAPSPGRARGLVMTQHHRHSREGTDRDMLMVGDSASACSPEPSSAGRGSRQLPQGQHGTGASPCGSHSQGLTLGSPPEPFTLGQPQQTLCPQQPEQSGRRGSAGTS